MKLIIIFILIILLFFCGCDIPIKHISSPNGKYWITLFDKSNKSGKNYTYISYGKHTTIPNHWIRARNRYRDTWYCLIEWKDDKVIVYQPYSFFEEDGENENMELKEMEDIEFFKTFDDRTDDHFIRLCGYEIEW